jgi:hypothetical protein
MKNESKIDLSVLRKTADNDLLIVYPRHKFGFKRSELRKMKRSGIMPKAKDLVSQDRDKMSAYAADVNLKRKYKEALQTIARLESQRDGIVSLKDTVETYTIKAKKASASSEATAVWVASDWHTDEIVEESTVNGLNHYTPLIAQHRVNNFFTSCLTLTNMSAKDVKIDTIVLALLGDFFTGHIHPDFMELTDTQPIHAVIRVQNMIASGIQYILDNSDYKLVIPCHSGNHARTTEKTRFATENGHSLEFYMYHFLADHFKGEKRVKFVIATGQMSYMDIYSTKIRFMHGHSIRYGGGVGGIYIPVNKAISQWDKSCRADLTVFGHFHQLRDGGNFICNGSVIGYSSFALSIKADYEKPRQALFLVNSRHGVNCVWKVDVQ